MRNVRYVYTSLHNLSDLGAADRLTLLTPAIHHAQANRFRTEIAFGSEARKKLDELLEIAQAVEGTFIYALNLPHSEHHFSANEHFEDLSVVKRIRLSNGNATLFFVDSSTDTISNKFDALILFLEDNTHELFPDLWAVSQ